MNLLLKLTFFLFLLNALDAYELDFSSSETLTLSISNSPYEFNKTAVVPLGKTLVIEPGVELRLAPSVSVLVEGTLIANGTNEQRIKFKPLTNSDYFDSSFGSRFANFNLTGGFCVPNSDEPTNKEVATAICREMGYMGESYLFDFVNSAVFSSSNPFLSVSKCDIKSTFLEDNCVFSYVWQCFNGFRSVHCSQPPIHNYWSGLFFTKSSNNQANKSVLAHVDLEKGGLNKTCCSPPKMNHAVISVQGSDSVVLNDVKISDSASNGLSIQSMNQNTTTANFDLNNIQITNVFLNAIEISNKNSSNIDLSNSEIKSARTGLQVDALKGALRLSNVSFQSNKRGIHVDDQSMNQLNVTLSKVSFLSNEMALNDESKSRLQIDEATINNSTEFGVKKSKGSLHVTSTEFRSNNVSVFLLNSNDLDVHINGNNFSQDLKHSVFCNDTYQDSSFTLQLSENRFERNQFQTVQITLKLAKNTTQSESNVLIDSNAFTENVGLSVLDLRFVYDFDSLTNYPNRVRVTNNKFLDNEIYTYDDPSVNIKKHGVLGVSLASSLFHVPPYTNATGYQWQQMLRNVLIENNTFANPKSTFEVATFYTNYTLAYEHLVKFYISSNNWLSYSNELDILSRINAYHLNQNLSIVVQIYPLYLNGTLNAFSPSGSIVASGNRLGYYVNKDYVLEAGVYNYPYGMLIEQGSSLTLMPNVTIEFQPNTKILVLGKLDLKGELKKEVHLKFIEPKLNQTNNSSSSFNYEKRLRLSSLNISNLYWSQFYRNYKLVEVFVDSKWQPICYNWDGQWIYDYERGYIWLKPPIIDFLPLLCKWMGVGDCDAQSISLSANIFTLYPNYVNEFDFDPNFHSNISEVKMGSCKSNCVCTTFLAFFPVTSSNVNPQSAAVHYTTYAQPSLITNVLASNFPTTVFRIDNQKHLIENVRFENGNLRSVNAFTIHKQDPWNANRIIKNIKSTLSSLRPVNITLFQNGLTLTDLSNISITNHLVANLEVLNSEFLAFDLHLDECEPRLHLENEQISLMTLNSAKNLSCSMNLSANAGRRIAVSLVGVENTLCSTNLSVRNGTSDIELLLLQTGSNGELRNFFASDNNALNIHLEFSSSCTKWNHLKLKFESIDSTIDVNQSALANSDSVKIANSYNVSLINKMTRHTPNAYSNGNNKEMRVENVSVWSWLVDDAYTSDNLQLKDIYHVFVNNVTFTRSITSDKYTLSDIHITDSNFKLIPTKFSAYKMSISNSQFDKTIEGFYSFTYLNIRANYLNLLNNTFTETRIAFISPCFEMSNNRFLSISTDRLMSLDTDQDLLKLGPQTTCNQLIDANLFFGNPLYSSYNTLFFADFYQYSYWYTYLRNKDESSRLELNVQFRNNVVRNLDCAYLLSFYNQYYVQFEQNIGINVELDSNLFVDSDGLSRIISISLADEQTVKFTNNTFSNVSTLTLFESVGLIEQLEIKSNKFVNCKFYGQMELFVDKQFFMEHNEFANNTIFYPNMFKLHVLDSSPSSVSNNKASLRNNTFNRNTFNLDYQYSTCVLPSIEIECVRLDDILISDNQFDNQILDRRVYPYQLSDSITELIIKFTDSQLNPNWFANEFLVDLSTNNWGTTRTQARVEKLVYVKSTEFDSLFKAMLTQSITSSIETSFSGTCRPLGGYLLSGQTLRLTKANSPYYIHSTWIIESNARVEVEPGVDLKMAKGVKVIVYGSLVMNGTANEKIRINHNSVNCSHERENICTFYNQYSATSINYIVFRTKQAQEQSVLRHVELNKDTSLFVDGYTPIIEHLMSENNREDAAIIIFRSLNDIELNSVTARETRQYSVLIYEQERNIRIDAGIFNRTVLITKEIGKYIKPYLLESVNWGREYTLQAKEDLYLNFHFNSENKDCYKKMFVVVKAEPGQIISVWSETRVNSLSNMGFKFLNSDNQKVEATDLYTQLTWQNYLRIEMILTSCFQLNRIVLRFKSVESIFALNDFSEPSKSSLFPPSLFALNNSVSNWFVTSSTMNPYYSPLSNRLVFRFNQTSVNNQTKLNTVETVELSKTQRICGLEFEIDTYYDWWTNGHDNSTFAIYFSTAQGDMQILSKTISYKNKVCHALGCFDFQDKKKYRIINGSLFNQHDTFKFKFQVLNSKRNLEIALQDVSVLKCHLMPHEDSVNITVKNSHLFRVNVDNWESTSHGYNVLLDSNVFFNQKYDWLYFETELKSPVQINVARLNKLTLSNSMVYYSQGYYSTSYYYTYADYFTQIIQNYETKTNYIIISNDKTLVQINSNYIWRNKFQGFVLTRYSIGYFETTISNNTIKNNTFAQAMISYQNANLRSSVASIEITSNFITLNDDTTIILTNPYGPSSQLPPRESPLVKINRNAFFFNSDFKIETSFPTNLIEENAFLRNVALQDLYYIVYQHNAVDVPSQIGNWWNTLDVRELADWFSNYNASRLLADIPSSLDKYNLKNSYCERGWTQLNGKCYLKLPVQLTYANGVQTCANLSSILANFDANSFDQFKRLRNSSSYEENDHVWLRADLEDAQCKSIQTSNGSIDNSTSCLGFNHVICEQEQTCSNLQCNQSNAICQGSRCICADGWHGPSCNEFNCNRLNNCSNRGTCIGPNRCACDENWRGRSCSSHFCFLFDHCGTCTSQQGCGWCDEAKRCLPATSTDRQPEREFNCSTWFYYNCLTPSDSECSSLGIENMPSCGSNYCKVNSTDFNKVTCQQCRDFDACFSNATTCRAWNETKCPFGKIRPDYSDPNRLLFADLNPNVLTVDTKANVVIYKCPIKKPSTVSKDIEVLLFKSELLADLIRLDSIIQSELSKGIFHKVKRIQRLGDYRLAFAHMANLKELYTYADFEMPVKKMFEFNENDQLFEPVQEDVSPDLIARIQANWNASQAFDMATSTHFMCQGNKYESVENGTLTQGYTVFLLVKKTSYTLQFAESDLIYRNVSDLVRYLETIDSIEVQSDAKYGEKVFVKTHLTDCNTELTEATLTNLLNRSVASSDLDCFGGRNMNESVYVFDNEDMDNQQHKLFKPNDVVQGRSGIKGFVLQILNKTVFNDFLLFECKQIESLPDVNQLAYYERVYQVLNTQTSRIEGEAGGKVRIPKLGGSVSFGKVSLKTDFDLDADVNFNFKPFSVGFGMSIYYDIVVTLNGAGGFSKEFDNKPILWRFFIPAPPPFVRIPGEFELSGKPEVSIDVDTDVQTQVQFRGSKKFYKEFKLNDDSDTNLADSLPTLSKPPLNGNKFLNFKIEAKYTLQVKLGIPSYRILVEKPTKFPDWLEVWELDVTIFELNVFFALPFGLKIELDTCFDKCYDKNDEQAMALKVAFGNLGCEAGAGLTSFSAEVQTKFNLCVVGVDGSLFNQHWCYTSIPKPPERCPCKCEDGTKSERDENGECKCDCTCEDGTKDKIDKSGKCPCKCKCKNCKESVRKANGCYCPDDNQKCPEPGVVGQWVNCKFECEEKNPCGNPPYCTGTRRGPKCKTPFCPQGCVNGICVASGTCGSRCRCFQGWQGARCDRRRTRGNGDPWFSTFNGFIYGFQGLGEYWHCLDMENDVGIQIRTYLFGGLNSFVSSISGVAVKLSNSVFTVFLNENMAYVFRLDNKIIPNKNAKIVLNNSLNGMEEVINIDLRSNLLAIDRKDHSSVTIYMNNRNIDLNVDLYPSINTKGLCGRANKLSDDFHGPDGKQYSTSWLFGKSWQITNTNSLNSVKWSWNSSNFHPDDRMNILYDEQYLIYREDRYHTVLSLQARMANPLEKLLVQRDDSRARQLCEQNELKGDMLTTCILDILATGDESFAQTELYKTELCPNNCNGHGTCLSKGVCNCTEGWTGANCNIGQCQYDCAPNGKCTGGFCVCQDGWDGVDCQTKASCDLVANCTDSNHGICVKTNVCKCYAGFGGNDCSQISLCLPLNKCNENGYCASGKCTCNTGWTSADCSKPSCESRGFCSAHGTCVGFDLCQCDEFYTGDSCSVPQCPQVNECSTNGKCIAPNTCSCYPGFKDPDCLQRVECPQLNNCNDNGVCVKNATECVCYGGYEGAQCEIIRCDQVQNCSAHGKCVEPNLCECDFGYKGTFCNETTCESLNFCSYNGLCNERQECNCTTGWSGRDCSVAECSQVNFCSGNGVCIEPNKCQCFQNFDDLSCASLIGENLFSPRFNVDTYETRVNELATIGTFILRVNATDADKNNTRNSLVKYSIQTTGDFYDYFEMDEVNGSIYLKKSLLLLDKSALSIYVIAYDQGTPRKSASALVKVNLDRSLSCNDILNPVMNEISLTKSATPSVKSFELKPADLTNRNVSYLLSNLEAFLRPFVYLDEITGRLQVNSSIFVGSYELNVLSKQFYEEEICKKKMGIQLRVSSAPIINESSSTTTSTSITSTETTTRTATSTSTTSTETTTVTTTTTSSSTQQPLSASSTMKINLLVFLFAQFFLLLNLIY